MTWHFAGYPQVIHTPAPAVDIYATRCQAEPPMQTKLPPLPVGERIRQARLDRGLTQQELGVLVNVYAVTVSRWERGEQNPGERARLYLAKALSRPDRRYRPEDFEA